MPSSTAPGGLNALLRRPAVMLLLALLALAAIVTLLGRLTGGSGEPRKTALSREPGAESFPSFSPDGERVVYSGKAPGKGEVFHLYVRPVTGGAARALTSGDASDIGPVFSPDGARIAFVRMGESDEVLVIPAAGGEPRKLAETDPAGEARTGPSLTWTRDGKALVAVLRSAGQPAALAIVPLDGAAPKKITTPPEGADGDAFPAVSPDGLSLAFVRRSGPDGGDIYVTDLAGANPRRLTFDDHPIRGLAWTADSREIVYAGNRVRDWELWRVPASGGSARVILDAGRKGLYPAIARKGHRMVFAESPSVSAIWRLDVTAPEKEKPIVQSAGRDSAPSFSPDGKRLAFRSDRTGADEIWTADIDGEHQKQVTSMKGPRLGRPRWSPDGKLLAFDARKDEHPDVYTAPAGGGEATRVTNSGSSSPAFSPDGKWIYGGTRQIWRRTLDGGAPTQITQRGGSGAVASLDGKWIYYQRGREIRRVAAAGGDEEELYQPEMNLFWGSLAPGRNGVYFLEWERRGRAIQVTYYDAGAKKATAVLKLERPDMERGVSFDITPDGKTVLYSKVDQTETNLMLLDGFR